MQYAEIIECLEAYKKMHRFKETIDITCDTCELYFFYFFIDVWERGPSLPAAIPGFTLPLGLCSADVPDILGAMTPCPHKVVFVTI